MIQVYSSRLCQNVDFFYLVGLLCIRDIFFLFLHQNISCGLQTYFSLRHIVICVDLFGGRTFLKGWIDLIKLSYLPSEFKQTGPSKQCRPRSDATERGV